MREEELVQEERGAGPRGKWSCHSKVYECLSRRVQFHKEYQLADTGSWLAHALIELDR